MATNKTTAVNQNVRLREWSAQLEAQQSSGMTVPEWCAANGIKTKSFYYHLRKVREQYIQSAQAIVPVTVPQQQPSEIHIESQKKGLQITVPSDVASDTLLALVKTLC